MAKKKARHTSTKPAGQSKYARKVKQRRKVAHRFNLTDAPWPVLWALIDDQATTESE